MNNELKPCPFCGAQPTLLHPEHEGIDDYVIGCYNDCCGFSYERARSKNKQEVIDAWNARAVLPVQTCIFTYDEDLHYWECSECKGTIYFASDSPNSPKDNDYRYCPCCGRKIIKEIRNYE